MILLQQAAGNLARDQQARTAYSLFPDDPNAAETFLKVLLIFALIALALVILYHLQQRAQGDRARRPVRLLWELAGAASIGWWDRLLLIRMTRQARLANPAVVLLSANSYDRVVGLWLRTGGGEGAARLKRLRGRLFRY